MIPVEYNLWATDGDRTLYFFNEEEAQIAMFSPRSGTYFRYRTDTFDWMQEQVGEVQIEEWGRFDDIHLVKAQSPRKKVSVSMKVPDVSEEHLSKMRYIIVKNTKMGNKIRTIYQKLLAYLEAFDEQCGVDSKWIQSIMDEYEATAGLEEMTVKEEDGAK